tara:strand:- start:3543 stop:3842 length:300 start_codon:yes stop_codon:yes gene_type:complete
MRQGGLSTSYADRVAGLKRDIYGKIAVYANREATLTVDMKGIQSRYLRNILLVDMDGYGDKENVIPLSRNEAGLLRDALSLALRVTEDDVSLSDRYADE